MSTKKEGVKMREYTKQAIMNVMAKLVIEQIKNLQVDKVKHKLNDDIKFEIYSGSSELLEYGLYDVCEAFYFAEKYLENYDSIQSEIWKDGEDASYKDRELFNKVAELVLKTKA